MCTLCPVTIGVAAVSGSDISSVIIILLQACFFLLHQILLTLGLVIYLD